MRKTTWIIFGVFSSTSDFDDHFEGPQKCNAVLNLIINHLRTWLYFQYEQCTIVLTSLSFGQCESTWSIVFNNKKHPHIWLNVSLVMSTTDGKKCGCVFFFVWWMCVLDSFRNSYTFYRSNTKTPNIVREKIHKKNAHEEIDGIQHVLGFVYKYINVYRNVYTPLRAGEKTTVEIRFWLNCEMCRTLHIVSRIEWGYWLFVMFIGENCAFLVSKTDHIWNQNKHGTSTFTRAHY